MTRNNRPPSSNKVVQYGLWPVLDSLKIPRCGLQAFRHRHASLLLHAGATPKVVQEQLRHADPRVTLGMYSRVIGEDRRNAVERVAVLLRPTADASCARLRPDAPKSGEQGSGFNKLVGAGDGNRIVSLIHKSCDLTALPPKPESNGVKWRQNGSLGGDACQRDTDKPPFRIFDTLFRTSKLEGGI